ncbi:MAG: aryl-sulfate sulfotransferase [Bacteroidota bacterium]
MIKKILYRGALAAMLLISVTGCRPDAPEDVLQNFSLVLNSSGYAPLSALLRFSTVDPVTLTIHVEGKHGPESDVTHTYIEPAQFWSVPVLGLYADHANLVTLTVRNTANELLAREEIVLETEPLIADLPGITIDQKHTNGQNQLYLVNYFGFAQGGDFSPQRPFIFDQFGDIRWYLDFTNHPFLNTLFYDNGLTILQNGNFIMGDVNTGSLYEINYVGGLIDTWSLNGYEFHHHVIEKPNGNFLVTVSDPAKATVEDVIIEISRLGKSIVNTWDLNQSLDNQRRAWPTDLADLEEDWFHGNGLAFDESDNSIIVSGRTQGVVKLSSNNVVQWILAPHREWNEPGGKDLTASLLQPLDAGGSPITDASVLDGATHHPDFEWSWYQHSPIILPDGDLMLFDNGDNRNYTGNELYSRAVTYRIDEANKTIQQRWQYGKEKGEETYSRIVSKVNYYEADQSVLFTPGAINFQGQVQGKLIEVGYQSNQKQFEATVVPPDAVFNISFHNARRISFYP